MWSFGRAPEKERAITVEDQIQHVAQLTFAFYVRPVPPQFHAIHRP